MAPNIGESSTGSRKSTRVRRPNRPYSPGKEEEGGRGGRGGSQGTVSQCHDLLEEGERRDPPHIVGGVVFSPPRVRGRGRPRGAAAGARRAAVQDIGVQFEDVQEVTAVQVEDAQEAAAV